MAQVRARGGHNPGMVILKLEPSLLAAVEDGLAEEGRSAPLCTGHAAFDALNQSLGTRGVVANSRLKTIYIYLDPRTDVLFAALEYNKTAGVMGRQAYCSYVSGLSVLLSWEGQTAVDKLLRHRKHATTAIYAYLDDAAVRDVTT